MTTVDMHDAQDHLSDLVEKAVNGAPFIIAKAGKPLVKVVALDPPPTPVKRRAGFMKGQIKVPDDFDSMYAEEIADLFEGKS